MTDGNVLINATDKNKSIALYDYLKWLKCNYQLGISTKRDKDDFISNLTEQQLCNGKPLQSYLPIETKKQGVNGWIAFLMMLGLFGCVSSSKINSQKTQLELILRSQQGNSDKGITPILKVSPTLKSKCDISGNNIAQYFGTACHRLENYDALTIEYAIIPRLQNRQADEQSYINQHAQSLPPSAWRTYTIYPKQLLEQGRAMPANGSPAKTWAHGTKVIITLYIDSNGNISQTIEHEPIRKNKWTT
ncbi:hypothetical protein [Spirabiliibacterium falconis]|uniref:hypothetical protein n=1 Tax=Spirabiliibacterium falconis TaxID=572023 RepID=UPI001AACFA55|nr:hypothetical protein [Spirabiliibacterium falconis]MBE2893513.1 hypothetical protein [Spirabiliibacterium falconis]